jgi:hypothetical protein
MKPRTMLARGTIMWLALAGQAASAQHPVAATEAPVANLAAKPALVPDASPSRGWWKRRGSSSYPWDPS